jgi:hypothetical protein
VCIYLCVIGHVTGSGQEGIDVLQFVDLRGEVCLVLFQALGILGLGGTLAGLNGQVLGAGVLFFILCVCVCVCV